MTTIQEIRDALAATKPRIHENIYEWRLVDARDRIRHNAEDYICTLLAVLDKAGEELEVSNLAIELTAPYCKAHMKEAQSAIARAEKAEQERDALRAEVAKYSGKGSEYLADAIITLLEGRYRDWLSPQEYGECKAEIAGIISTAAVPPVLAPNSSGVDPQLNKPGAQA